MDTADDRNTRGGASCSRKTVLRGRARSVARERNACSPDKWILGLEREIVALREAVRCLLELLSASRLPQQPPDARAANAWLCSATATRPLSTATSVIGAPHMAVVQAQDVALPLSVWEQLRDAGAMYERGMLTKREFARAKVCRRRSQCAGQPLLYSSHRYASAAVYCVLRWATVESLSALVAGMHIGTRSAGADTGPRADRRRDVIPSPFILMRSIPCGVINSD